MERNPYPSDVSDDEWALVAPYLTLMTEDAPQREHRLREVCNGRRWLVRAGAAWRLRPHDLPPWPTVSQQSQRWLKAGVFDAIVAVWRRVIDIDLTGVFLGCKRALKEMLPRGHKRIINMASVAGLNGTGGGAAYIAAKHGVVGLTRQMAVVYAARGITVNCVCPGPISTGLRQHSQDILGPDVPDMSSRGVAVNDDQIRALIPAGIRGRVEDIAAAVCFLASDEAAYITGHSLVVDGGWRAK